MDVTLERALELMEDKIFERNGNKYIAVEDLKTLSKEFQKLDKAEKDQEPEEQPKTMDEAKIAALHRISEANLKTPSGAEAVKS